MKIRLCGAVRRKGPGSGKERKKVIRRRRRRSRRKGIVKVRGSGVLMAYYKTKKGKVPITEDVDADNLNVCRNQNALGFCP